MKWYIKVLTNYATFGGRARRKEYWMFFLFNILIGVILTIIGMQAGFESLGNLYSLVVLIPGIAVAVRRMHDVNKSGWYCLIPIYNLILACTEGTQGDNEYGPDPKQEMGDTPEILHS
jgi:uncharacterized membrane protein YhaH (DUF805 family)